MSEIRVRVAWSGEAGQGEISLQLTEPATVQSAIEGARQLAPALELGDNPVAVGVWGKVRAADHPLRDGDRVELYRALRADPKAARRQNAERNPGKTRKM
ncbi:MAG: RnfH family protein [Betaproteobacteria bacterium]